MDTTVRYHLVMDNGNGRVMILDTHTGNFQYPACWQDIAAYYHYLAGRNRHEEAQNLLAESMSGQKPITRMVEKSQRMETVLAR